MDLSSWREAKEKEQESKELRIFVNNIKLFLFLDILCLIHYLRYSVVQRL